MRPVKLTLSAFISYKNKQTIDFTEIDGSNLFLITGETGAGKSTIFDAICFALYGKLSGDGGEKTNFLKCHLAGEKDICKVEFVFKIGEQLYTVQRIPTQMVYSERKGEMISKQGSVTLELPDGEVITKTNEANSYIEKLIGLDHKQFKKVVMLAQGEFKEFLVSDSSEKQQILRKIFGTEIFDNLSKELANMEKLLETKINEQKNLVDTYIKKFIADDEKIVDALKMEEINVKEFLPIAKEYLTKKREEILCNREKLQNMREDLSKINVEECKKTNDNFEKLSEATQVYENLQNSFDEQKQRKLQLQRIKSARKIVPIFEKNLDVQRQVTISQENLQVVQEQYKNLIPRFCNAEKNYSEIGQLQEKSAKLNSKITELKLALELATKKEEKECLLRQKKEKEKNIGDSLQLIKLLIARAEKTELSDAINEISSITAQRNQLGLDFEIKKQQNNSLREDFDKTTKDFYNATASFIAQNLRENEACPVCGSIHHPKIAQQSKDVSKEILQQKQDRLEKSNQQLIKIETSLSSINEKLTEKMAAIGVCADEVNVLAEKNKSDISDCNNAILKIVSQQKIADKKYMDKQYLCESQTNLIQSYGTIKGEISSLKNEIEDICLPSVECLEKEVIEKQISEISHETSAITEQIQTATEAYNALCNEKSVLEERQKSSEEQYHLSTEQSKMLHEKFQQVIKESVFENDEEFMEIIHFIENEEAIEIQCKNFENSQYEAKSQKEFLEKELVGKNKVDID
ncbi:MAG: SMC family ATPase, partial [Oscillospiraceae bacterium]